MGFAVVGIANELQCGTCPLPITLLTLDDLQSNVNWSSETTTFEAIRCFLFYHCVFGWIFNTLLQQSKSFHFTWRCVVYWQVQQDPESVTKQTDMLQALAAIGSCCNTHNCAVINLQSTLHWRLPCRHVEWKCGSFTDRGGHIRVRKVWGLLAVSGGLDMQMKACLVWWAGLTGCAFHLASAL